MHVLHTDMRKVVLKNANQNSGIQMSTHILRGKYAISKNLIPIYDLKGLISTHKGTDII
jgi:hypothetical protein